MKVEHFTPYYFFAGISPMPTITAVAAFIVSLVLFASANAQIDETGNTRATRIKIQKIVKVVRVPEVRYQKISGVAITTVQPNAEVSIKTAGGGKYKQNLKT